jgi:[acyl-carrier-protein] S-malonyltransferase
MPADDAVMREMIKPVDPAGTTDALIYEDELAYEQVVLAKDPFKTRFDPKEIQSGQADPFLASHQDPHVFADGILAPKPLKEPFDWEPMGLIEYRALYYALCKFNQINRSGIEYKKWGEGRDEKIFSFADTTPYAFVTGHLFLTVLSTCIGPTARKLKLYQDEHPEEHKALLSTISDICGGLHVRISVKQFMEVAKHWKKAIGVPRDFHAACADFVPGACNILRLRKCAVMMEYDRKLLELGGTPFGAGVPNVPNDPMPSRPREPFKPQAILFAGDGSQKLGMLQTVKDLPRIAEKLRVATEILGYDILKLCVEGPEADLEFMEHTGVAMYVAGWAAYEKFLHEDPENARSCQAVAGIEVGEYVALSVAGVLPFECGLELAYVRGIAMKELAELVVDQAVCSVAGLKEDRVKQLCELAKSTSRDPQDVCQIITALFNRGYVVGGKTKSVEAFQNLAAQDGALQVKILPGQKANHSPLMKHVQWVIKSKLREWKHKIRVPWCDIYFNAQGDYCLKANGGGKDPTEALEEVISKTTQLLCEACYTACRWDGVMQSLLDAKITKFYECGPTKQLKALIKRIQKEAFENTFNYTV